MADQQIEETTAQMAQISLEQKGDTTRYAGTVKWFDPRKGFGFITVDGKEDVYVHHSAIQAEGFRILYDEQEVELEIVTVADRERAANVTGPQGAKLEANRTRNTQRGDKQEWTGVEAPKGKVLGTVKWFNNKKGFGFISYGADGDVFVHQTSIVSTGYRTLFDGQQVSFEVKNENGRDRALNVTNPDGTEIVSPRRGNFGNDQRKNEQPAQPMGYMMPNTAMDPMQQMMSNPLGMYAFPTPTYYHQ